jgi:hypothetical protein
MKNQPTKIFLQTGLEDNGETCEDFNELHGISWCSDKIYGDDLEYVSIDAIFRRIKELETEISNEESIYSEASCRFRIDELKNLLQ